jgi:peptide deformylase
MQLAHYHYGARPVRIIKYPHPTLRHKSKPLRLVDAELRKTVREMLDVMYQDRGVGLAANQVDLPYRLFVMNPQGDPAAIDQEYVFINPIIVKRAGSAEAEEGCLSFPDIYAPVRRSEKIVLTAYDLTGKEITCELSGLPARAAQHETDHLDGVLFIDRLSPAARLSVRQALADLEQEFHGDRQRGLIPGDDQIIARLVELEAARAS